MHNCIENKTKNFKELLVNDGDVVRGGGISTKSPFLRIPQRALIALCIEELFGEMLKEI